MKNYINACVSKNSLTKTFSIYSMAESLGFAFVTFLTSIIMEISGNSYVITNFSLVALFIIPLIISAIYFIRALVKNYTIRCTIIRKDIE